MEKRTLWSNNKVFLISFGEADSKVTTNLDAKSWAILCLGSGVNPQYSNDHIILH